MIALVNEGIFQELFQRLDIQVINDFGESSECIGFVHFIVSLADVFGETTDDDEDFIFIGFQFLFNK